MSNDQSCMDITTMRSNQINIQDANLLAKTMDNQCDSILSQSIAIPTPCDDCSIKDQRINNLETINAQLHRRIAQLEEQMNSLRKNNKKQRKKDAQFQPKHKPPNIKKKNPKQGKKQWKMKKNQENNSEGKETQNHNQSMSIELFVHI